MKRILLALWLIIPAAHAETIAFGYTTGDSVSAFVAKDHGDFAREHLDVSLQYVAMNSNMPAALVSGSLQAASTTASVFLQAVDNGIDLVAIAGASDVGPQHSENMSILTRPGFMMQSPADLRGRKIGVPGFGAIMQVLLEEWLRTKGVDPAAPHYVEATFVSMGDLIRAGTVDAVITIEPFTSRIVAVGAQRYGSFIDELPGQIPNLIYVTTRAWAEAHKDQVAGLRRALVAASEWGNAHPDEARAAIAAYTKVPMAVLQHIPPPVAAPSLEEGFGWLAGVMRQQGLLHGAPEKTDLIAP
jgi:NitT/TauT family transport system substrate-binding protein